MLAEFRKAAKLAFPREAFAYLLGRDAGTLVEIEELYFPEDVAEHATHSSVDVQHHWELDAKTHASDSGLSIVGDLHSHPYNYLQTDGVRQDCVPSESDHESRCCGIVGICVVTEQRSGQLRSTIKFWPPMTQIETKIT